MKNTILASIVLFAAALNLAAPTYADSPAVNAAVPAATELVSLLPPSDAVVSIDAGRLMGEAVPTLLSANQPLLAKIMDSFSEMQAKTGINVRQLGTVAVGFRLIRKTAKTFDVDPVAVARGEFNAGALIGLAKLAASGKYRTERVGTRSLTILTTAEVAGQHVSKLSPQKAAMLKKASQKLSAEMALTAFDANTIVVGSPARVRELLVAQTKISPELIGYLNTGGNSVVNFAANVPKGMSAFLPLENDEIGRNLDAIRAIYGSVSVAADTTTLNATAKMLQPSDAQSLKETLDGLQMIGKAVVGGAKGADKDALARLIENARITKNDAEVSLALSVPQSDIDLFVGNIK